MFEFKQNLVRNAFSRFSEYTVTLKKKIEYKKARLKIESLKRGKKDSFSPVFFISDCNDYKCFTKLRKYKNDQVD